MKRSASQNFFQHIWFVLSIVIWCTMSRTEPCEVCNLCVHTLCVYCMHWRLCNMFFISSLVRDWPALLMVYYIIHFASLQVYKGPPGSCESVSGSVSNHTYESTWQNYWTNEHTDYVAEVSTLFFHVYILYTPNKLYLTPLLLSHVSLCSVHALVGMSGFKY